MCGERAGWLIALLLGLAGCDAALCNRSSDCAGGQVCTPAGVCLSSDPLDAPDADAPDADADALDADADAPDALDADADADVDATPVDAPDSDAAIDAPIDAPQPVIPIEPVPGDLSP